MNLNVKIEKELRICKMSKKSRGRPKGVKNETKEIEVKPNNSIIVEHGKFPIEF